MAHQRKGAAHAKESAPLHSTSSADSIVSAPLFHPAARRSATPASSCGAKPKAPARTHRPRRIDPALFAFLALAVLEYLLIRGAT